MNGVQVQRERWKRGVGAVNGAMGEAVGEIYVKDHYPTESERQMTELIANLREAYQERISHNSWMDQATRTEALAKLAAFEPRIGHPTMRIAAEIAGGHHERWDGTGYPLGVTGDKIPYSARITAVADVFDALTHARCYKKAWSTPDAIAEISRGRGTVFDPLVVDAFMAVIVELINQHGHDGVDDVLSANSKDNALITAREFLTNQMSGQRNVS
mgnify:CR=1 FL=1